MELADILALLDRFDGSSAARMELELGELKLCLEKGGGVPAAPAAPIPVAPAPAAPAPAAPTEIQGSLVKAPLVGTFYAAPAPGEAPFAAVGDTVKKGETLCVLEAMKMMSEVPAPTDCVILEVLVRDGDLVGFDAPLFRVREL